MRKRTMDRINSVERIEVLGRVNRSSDGSVSEENSNM